MRCSPYFEAGATIEGRYRYTLRRRWALHQDGVCWIMLNPSTADERQDDPTIRRCVGFSQRWGYGWLIVVNLFAVRATNPKALRLPPNFYQSEHEELIGRLNDDAIQKAAAAAKLTVAAWGNHGALYNRGDEVREMLDPPLHHLGLTKAGQPRHPLYAPRTATPVPWIVDTGVDTLGAVSTIPDVPSTTLQPSQTTTNRNQSSRPTRPGGEKTTNCNE